MWRRNVEELQQLRCIERSCGIEDHPRRGTNLATLLEPERGGHGVADAALALATGNVRRQQPDGRISHQLAGQRIDCLQQPGCGRGGGIDAGRDTQHVATRAAQVEVALEVRTILRHVDADVAKLQITEAEGARTQSRVELRDDADLRRVRRRIRRVLEADRVRQCALCGQELAFTVTLRSRDRCLTGILRRELVQLLQFERRQFIGGRHRGKRAVRCVSIRREHIERGEIRRVREPEIVIR